MSSLTLNSKCFLVVLILSFFLSCNGNLKNFDSAECQAFALLLENEWEFNESISTYYFKGDPEFWYNPKYFVEPCLIGKTRKDIIKVFGPPSKDFKFINFSYYTYCMDENCLRTVKSDGRQITIFFDSAGIVNKSSISPPIQIRNFND